MSAVAGAMAPFRRWNTAEDKRPVEIDESSLRKALNVAVCSDIVSFRVEL